MPIFIYIYIYIYIPDNALGAGGEGVSGVEEQVGIGLAGRNGDTSKLVFLMFALGVD